MGSNATGEVNDECFFIISFYLFYLLDITILNRYPIGKENLPLNSSEACASVNNSQSIKKLSDADVEVGKLYSFSKMLRELERK